MRIAILDDDDAQTEALVVLLESAGHSARAFRASKPFMHALRQETYDLLILDWNLPDLSGIEVLNWAHTSLKSPLPTLMLTGRCDEGDTVAALNAGADDYVVKPVHPQVLIARVNAILRRAYPQQDGGAMEVFGDFAFNIPSQTVSLNGDLIVLTAKEFGLALLLFRNLHRALSRSHILEMVWGRSADLQTRTLDMHISRIRLKLRLRPENGYRLTPIYSYGYRLERLAEVHAGEAW